MLSNFTIEKINETYRMGINCNNTMNNLTLPFIASGNTITSAQKSVSTPVSRRPVIKPATQKNIGEFMATSFSTAKSLMTIKNKVVHATIDTLLNAISLFSKLIHPPMKRANIKQTLPHKIDRGKLVSCCDQLVTIGYSLFIVYYPS